VEVKSRVEDGEEGVWGGCGGYRYGGSDGYEAKEAGERGGLGVALAEEELVDDDHDVNRDEGD
jgi:hypothetical protein